MDLTRNPSYFDEHLPRSGISRILKENNIGVKLQKLHSNIKEDNVIITKVKGVIAVKFFINLLITMN